MSFFKKMKDAVGYKSKSDKEREKEEKERQQVEGEWELLTSKPLVELSPIPSKLLSAKKLTDEEKKCVSAIVACLACTYEADPGTGIVFVEANSTSTSGKDLTEMKWDHRYFNLVVKYFDLDESVVNSFEPLLRTKVDPQPFLGALGEKWTSEERRAQIMLIVLDFSVVAGHGLDSRAQVILRELCNILGLSWRQFLVLECRYALTMLKHAEDESTSRNSWGQDAVKNKAPNNAKWKKYAKAGLFAAVGGVALVLTAGLAAPAIGAGVAALGASGTGAFIASGAGTALVASMFGAGGAYKIGYKAIERFSEVRNFGFVRVFKRRPMNEIEVSLLEHDDEQSDPPDVAHKNAADPNTSVVDDAVSESKDSEPQHVEVVGNNEVRKQVEEKQRQLAKAPPGADNTNSGPEVQLTVQTDANVDANVLSSEEKAATLAELATHIQTKTDTSSETDVRSADSDNPKSPKSDTSDISDEDALKLQTKMNLSLVEEMASKGIPPWPMVAQHGGGLRDNSALQTVVLVSGWVHKIPSFDESIISDLKEKCTCEDRSDNASSLCEACHECERLNADMYDYRRQWSHVADYLADSMETYVLTYESEIIRGFGEGVYNFSTKTAASEAGKMMVAKTVFAGLLAAFAWPLTIMSAADIIDNPWSLAMDRANKAAILLADALEAKAHGARPVSLIGYSVGARVIFLALEELSKRAQAKAEKERSEQKSGQSAKDKSKDAPEAKRDLTSDEYRGIVLDVVLLGTPLSTDKDRWLAVRSVVAGRLINGYSSSDWVLRFFYRAVNAAASVAGLAAVTVDQTIDGVPLPGIENYDLSDLVYGHHQYHNAQVLKAALQHIDFVSDDVVVTGPATQKED